MKTALTAAMSVGVRTLLYIIHKFIYPSQAGIMHGNQCVKILVSCIINSGENMIVVVDKRKL